LPPRTRRPPTERRRPAARRPNRRAGRKGVRIDRRRAWVLLALLVLVAVFPPARRTVMKLVHVVESAVAATRAEEARQRVVATYARKYGIKRELADAIVRAAGAEGVKVELAFRLVRVESAFRERAVSHVGAVGLTQLMPATAAELQPGITRAQMFDRDTNLRLGFRYFRWLLRTYDGDVELALHAYNRGPGTVARIRKRGGDPANGYADKVLGGPGASPVNLAPVHDLDTLPLGGPSHELGPARMPEGM
jgi:soluble lytic murein transglycosylase-like protein